MSQSNRTLNYIFLQCLTTMKCARNLTIFNRGKIVTPSSCCCHVLILNKQKMVSHIFTKQEKQKSHQG